MYKEYKKSKYWDIVSNSLEDLRNNNDIEIYTQKDYIVWYIIKKIEEWE